MFRQALQALLAGQSLWDTFTYTIQDSKGLTDKATVKVLVSGLAEPPSGQAVLYRSAGSGNTTSVPSLAASSQTPSTTASAAAHDAALRSATLDGPLGYLSWLYDFDLLSKSKKDNSVALGVDAVLTGLAL